MSKGLLNMDIVVWAAIAKHIECGQTAAWLGATCKRAYELVRKMDTLVVLMRYHVIDTEDLAQTLPVQKGALRAKKSNPKLVLDTLTTLLWYKHGINYLLLLKMLENPFIYAEDCNSVYIPRNLTSLHIRHMCDLLFRHNVHLEDGDDMVDDRGNVMTFTNHYGSCQKGRYLQTDFNIEDMEAVKHLLPGTFDWRLIHFPYDSSDAYNVRFHRGTSLQVFFRFNGPVQPELTRHLKKVTLPSQRVFRDSKRPRLDECVWMEAPIPEMELLRHILNINRRVIAQITNFKWGS